MDHWASDPFLAASLVVDSLRRNLVLLVVAEALDIPSADYRRSLVASFAGRLSSALETGQLEPIWRVSPITYSDFVAEIQVASASASGMGAVAASAAYVAAQAASSCVPVWGC